MTSGYTLFSAPLVLSAIIPTRYINPNAFALYTGEGSARFPLAAVTVKKIFIKVTSWSYDLAATLRVTVRKNGVDTILDLYANAAGTFTDTGDVAFADGDEISIRLMTDSLAGSSTFGISTVFL